jgi:hypothetical protein
MLTPMLASFTQLSIASARATAPAMLSSVRVDLDAGALVIAFPGCLDQRLAG